MASEEQQATGGRRRRPHRDLGRLLARILCALFALIGAVPLAAGLLLRSEPLQKWAAGETSRLLRQELGLEATFSVDLSLIPLRLAITDLTVPAIDGGSPAITAEVAAVSPRFFSLLAGRIDVGDIELENTQARLVISDGKLTNVSYRFPETDADERAELKRAPFRSLAITNASIDVEIDGTRVTTRGVDVDAFAEKNLSFDVALRTGEAKIDSTHRVEPQDRHDKVPPFVAHDEDRLCALDLRVLLQREHIVVRRLSLLGVLDTKNEKDTRPKCEDADDDRVALRLSQVKVNLQKNGPPHVRGHVMARIPIKAADRVVPTLRGTGFIGFSGDIATGVDSKLPEVTGQLTGARMSVSGYVIADELNAQVLVTGDVIQVPSLHALWGNGALDLKGLKVEPFAEKMPISINKIVSKDVDFPGLMRDVDVTDHSWVDWNLGNTIVSKVAGTLSPFYLDGGVDADTRDFTLWDKGYDDPTHKYMVGLKRAQVNGRFRAHSEALEFYNTDVKFGGSHLPVELVRIGFSKTGLIVRMKEGGGPLDLSDVSPVADVELSGKSQLFVDMSGPNLHPVLKGTLKVDDLSVGGFPAGDIKQSNVHFEPLFVEFTELVGQKGAMDYHLPSARLDFGGKASVEFTSAVSSKNFDIDEFFDAFHFDEDPRFRDIKGTAQVNSQVRYLLGGPEDACGGGRLTVSGSAELGSSELFEEKFNGGRAQFDFDWFDMDASTRGMRVNIPTLSLSKGSGAIFGSLEVHPGGVLSGNFLGTQIPVSRIDALGDVFGQADGFVTGVGQLAGTAEALSFSADVNVTEIKAGNTLLAPSHLQIQLVPTPPALSKEDLGTTGCGRSIPAPYTLADYEADRSDGDFIVNGHLFGGQIQFHDFSATSQHRKTIRGKATFHDLDVGAISALSMGGMAPSSLPSGNISGSVDIETLKPDDIYSSQAVFSLTKATLAAGQVKVSLHSKEARVHLRDGQVSTENLSLATTTDRGQDAILDARLTVNRGQQIDATFDLRPTNLGVITPAIEGITRAEGKLKARFTLNGALASPKVGGFIRVEGGKLILNGFKSPVTDLFIDVGLDDAGLHVEKGVAKWGGGTIHLGGDAPLLRGEIGRTNLTIAARGVTLPVDEGIRVGFDADLKLALAPPTDEEIELPSLSGSVDVLSASYKKPMRVTADISTLAARGEKTRVDGYDASRDTLRLDVLVRSGKPLRVENELVHAVLRIDPAGLRLTGTNQRFGAVGTVEVEQGGQVFLRQNEFEVQRGVVRFNDPTRLRPEVDVTAVTEYRRYEDRGATQGAEGQGAQGQAAESPAGGAPVAGNWRIVLHAYGPPDDLKVDLNSDPPLAQDDIFLLLTVGLTRTELEQTESSVGSSVALEALGSLSGAESAVTKAVPVDEFRFGSSYSSRSGRTEPTVTIGKRLSRRIRASVTTSLSDTSEVRSNIEYRATENLSVEGSYDNARDVASAAGGNLGGDVRWRLEFQ